MGELSDQGFVAPSFKVAFNQPVSLADIPTSTSVEAASAKGDAPVSSSITVIVVVSSIPAFCACAGGIFMLWHSRRKKRLQQASAGYAGDRPPSSTSCGEGFSV